MPLSQDVIDSVVDADFKNLGEAPGISAAILNAGQVAEANNMGVVRTAVTGMMAKSLIELDTVEAAANARLATGNDIADRVIATTTALQSAIRTQYGPPQP